MRIEVSRRQVTFPNQCACCGGSPDTLLNVTATKEHFDFLLAPDEVVLCATAGMMRTHLAGQDIARRAVCVATDRRCIFYNRRMFGRYDFEDVPYDRIASVQARKGLAWGAIDVLVAQVKKELYLTNNECAEAVGNVLREKVHDRTPLLEANNRGSLAPDSVASTTDIASQIRQLGDLAKEGLLTPQGFEEMKRKLLS